jgi:hypothetical protein
MGLNLGTLAITVVAIIINRIKNSKAKLIKINLKGKTKCQKIKIRSK